MGSLIEFSYTILGFSFIVNQQTATIAELWDGQNLKCTFRRCVDERSMKLWQEVVQIASTIELDIDLAFQF